MPSPHEVEAFCCYYAANGNSHPRSMQRGGLEVEGRTVKGLQLVATR